MTVFNCFQGELQEAQENNFEGALLVLKFLLLGVAEALPPEMGLSRLSKQLNPLVKSLAKVVKNLGPGQCFLIIEVFEFLILIDSRQVELGDVRELGRFDTDIIRILLQAEAFGNTDISSKNDATMKALFSLCKKDTEIYIEIVDELADEIAEKWHGYDESVILI